MYERGLYWKRYPRKIFSDKSTLEDCDIMVHNGDLVNPTPNL